MNFEVNAVLVDFSFNHLGVIAESLATLNHYITAERVSVLTLHAEFVVHHTLGHLEELDRFGVGLFDEAITLEDSNGWLNIDLAGVTLTSQIELNHWDRQELRVATGVDGHRYLRFLLVCSSKVLKTLGRRSHCIDRNILHDKVGKFEIGLSMLRAEVDLKLDGLSAANLALVRLDAVMSLFICE